MDNNKIKIPLYTKIITLFYLIVLTLMISSSVLGADTTGTKMYMNAFTGYSNQSSALYDWSLNDNGTNVGATLTNETWDFNANGEKISYSDFITTGFDVDLSLNIWFSPNDVSGVAYGKTLLSQLNSYRNGDFALTYYTSTLSFARWIGSSSTAETFSSTFSIDEGIDQHWVVNYHASNSTVTFYKNGLAENVGVTQTGSNNIGDGVGFGSTSNSIWYLNGEIYQGQVLNKSVDQTWVTSTYSEGRFYNPYITDSNFTIKAKDIQDSFFLTNFTANIKNSTNTYIINTTTGIINTIFPLNHSLLYNITVNSTEGIGYANKLYSNYNISNSGNLVANLYKTNSILINTYYENGTKLNDNFTVDFITSTFEFSNTTNENGTLFLYDLVADEYTIQVYNTNYNARTFFINITDGSFTELNVYFPFVETETKQLNVMTASDLPIENALITVTKLINSSYVAVGQQFSDSAGVSYFDLDNFKTYKLQIEASGYSTKTYILNTLPAIDTYDIVLLSNNTVNFTSFNDLVNYAISPSYSILNNSLFVENFTIITSSSQSLIQYITIYYNLTTFTNTTGSPAGSTTILNLNYTNLTNVKIDYLIKIQGYDELNISKNYYVNSDLNLNSSLRASIIELGENMEESRLLMIGAFAISIFTLLFSLLIPIDKADGTRGLNGIVILVGISFGAFLKVFPLEVSIVAGLLTFLGVLAD